MCTKEICLIIPDNKKKKRQGVYKNSPLRNVKHELALFGKTSSSDQVCSNQYIDTRREDNLKNSIISVKLV